MKRSRKIERGGGLTSALEHEPAGAGKTTGLRKRRDLIPWESFRPLRAALTGDATRDWSKGGQPPVPLGLQPGPLSLPVALRPAAPPKRAPKTSTQPVGQSLARKKSRPHPAGPDEPRFVFSPLTKLPGKSPRSRGALKKFIWDLVLGIWNFQPRYSFGAITINLLAPLLETRSKTFLSFFTFSLSSTACFALPTASRLISWITSPSRMPCA